MKPFFCILQPETETFHARQHLPLLGPFTKEDVSWLLLFSHVHLSSSCFTGSKWQLLLVALAGVSMVVTLTCSPCLPRRACASGSAFPLPWCCPAASAVGQGFGDCHLQRMGVGHVHAVTLFSCTSLHDWALQYLQHLGVAVAVCSCPHIPKFSSLLCVGDHKSPLALSMQVFQTQRRRSRPAPLFLAALSTSLLPKHCGRGGGRRCDTTLQPPGSCYWSALVTRWLYGTAQTIKINNKRGIQICSAHLAFHLLIAILASLSSKYFLFLFLILHIYQFQSEQLVTTNFIPS